MNARRMSLSAARSRGTATGTQGGAWRRQLAPLQRRWLALTARERGMARLAAGAVAILLVWLIGIAPALRTLHQVDLKRGPLDVQQQRMLVLRTEAEQLKAQPPKSGPDNPARALTQAVQERLGATAQVAIAGDRATLTLRGSAAGALADLLSDARVNARAVALEARLVRSPAGASNSLNTPNTPRGGVVTAPGGGGAIIPPLSHGFPVLAVGPATAAMAPMAPMAPAPGAAEPHWEGMLVMSLPPAP